MHIIDRHRIPPGHVRGVGKVELFDARRKTFHRKVEEVPFENFVSIPQKRYTERLHRDAFAQVFPSANTDISWVSGISHLCTSTDDRTEDPINEKWPLGLITAWSDRTAYVGAHVLRGGMNVSESLRDRTKIRYVFDWATNTGNGTFRSLQWVPSISDLTTVAMHNIWKSTISNENRTQTYAYSGMAWEEMGNSFDRATWNAWYAGSNIFSSRVNVEATTPITEFTAATVGGNVSDLAFDYTGATAMWLCSDASTSIRKRLKSDGSAVTSWIGPGGETGYRSIDFDGTSVWLLGVSGVVYRCTIAGAIMTSWTPSTFAAYKIGLTVDDEGVVWVGSDYTPRYVEGFTATGTKLAARISNYNEYTTLIKGGIDFARTTDFNDPIIGFRHERTSSWQGRLSPTFYPLGARTLLPSSVSKTSLQTMKITYEFQFS